MKRLSEDDYKTADKATEKFIREDIELVHFRKEEYDTLLQTIKRREEKCTGISASLTERRGWSSTPLSSPLRASAAAAFIAGLLYLTSSAFSGANTPSFPLYSNIETGIVGEIDIVDLKDSAGQFLERVGRSLNRDLEKTGL